MRLTIRNFGPIREAEMDFGDLTFLIGPQASGKSLSLELLKLIIDQQHIISTLRNYNYILNKKDATNLLEGYFGEGLSQLFKKDTEITSDGKNFPPGHCWIHSPSKRHRKCLRNLYSIFLPKEY